MLNMHKGVATLLLGAMLLATAGCGAAVVGGSVAAVGTYAYIQGESKGSFDTTIDNAFDAALKACEEFGIPILSERKTGKDGEIRGKYSGESVSITFQLVGAGITEISVRVGLTGHKDSSSRLLASISEKL